MSDLYLSADQKSQLQSIVDLQSQKLPQDQDWSGAYALIANAVQNADVTPGVKYFFQGATGVNGNSSE